MASRDWIPCPDGGGGGPKKNRPCSTNRNRCFLPSRPAIEAAVWETETIVAHTNRQTFRKGGVQWMGIFSFRFRAPRNTAVARRIDVTKKMHHDGAMRRPRGTQKLARDLSTEAQVGGCSRNNVSNCKLRTKIKSCKHYTTFHLRRFMLFQMNTSDRRCKHTLTLVSSYKCDLHQRELLRSIRLATCQMGWRVCTEDTKLSANPPRVLGVLGCKKYTVSKAKTTPESIYIMSEDYAARVFPGRAGP